MAEEPSLFPNQPTPEQHIAKHQSSAPAPTIVTVSLNDVGTRLKILEERYTTLRKKSQLTEQNIIEIDKEHYENLRMISDSMLGVKRDVRDLTEKISMLADEVQNFADKTELQTLSRYISFWEPMDFVTRKEVNNFLRRKFAPNMHAKPEPKHIAQSTPSPVHQPSTPVTPAASSQVEEMDDE